MNARLLWEAGISYGYGTDTTWPPKESLADELRAESAYATHNLEGLASQIQQSQAALRY